VTSTEESNASDSRRVLLEIVGTLEAIVVALQAERAGADGDFAIREAVRRVVALRHVLEAGRVEGG
jgi:hypothetical protein